MMQQLDLGVVRHPRLLRDAYTRLRHAQVLDIDAPLATELHSDGDPHEVDKAEAQHAGYGPVFMIGRERGQRDFMHLRKLEGRLRTDGAFSVDRLRW